MFMYVCAWMDGRIRLMDARVCVRNAFPNRDRRKESTRRLILPSFLHRPWNAHTGGGAPGVEMRILWGLEPGRPATGHGGPCRDAEPVVSK